ncbi:hypothetical protein OEZ85_004126 [Tetradesmus obliquus]|uniref:Non-specific serine/threonine protein kinase n=1 Tax=Tetradesmus obliquus TaxID=3088 RepID=A0ABY8UH78_TETOB|nr:hypothetical protein OEZ85_004126 [Tetradesmus obliquus]
MRACPRSAALGQGQLPGRGVLAATWQCSSCKRRSRATGCVARATLQVSPQLEEPHGNLIDSFGFKPNFSWEFQLGGMIGSGSFGVVHVATHLRSGRKYAVKSVPKQFFGQHLDPGFVARVQHEVDVSRHMGQSLNVVHLVEAYEDDVCVDLVLELACGGSLLGRIKRGSISEVTAARCIVDMLRAVAQCHAKGVAVCDVKPDNFLFVTPREDAPLKMADFGLAQYCRPGQVLSERVGTPYYVAPEVLRQAYGFPADVWSAGVTAYQLLTGRFPWHADPDWVEEQLSANAAGGRARSSNTGQSNVTNKALWRAIMYGQLDWQWAWHNVSDEARDFVQPMLTRDPEQRPTAAQLLRHPWLTASSRSLDEWDDRLAARASSSSLNIHSSSSASISATVKAAGGNGNGSSNGSSGNDSSSSSNAGRSHLRSQSLAGMRPLADTLVQRLQRYGTWGRLKQIGLRQVAKIMARDPGQLQGLAEVFGALQREAGLVAPLPSAAVASTSLARVDAAAAAAAAAAVASTSLASVDAAAAAAAGAAGPGGSVVAAAAAAAAPLGAVHGAIPLEAIRGLLVDGTYELSEVEVRQLMSQLDHNGDGYVSYDEWLALTLDWTAAQRSSNWETWVRQVFDRFDGDGSGRISTAELLELVGRHGPGFTSELDEEPYLIPDTVPSMMRRVDADGDGSMSFDEFLGLLQTDAADQLELFSSRRNYSNRQQ